ncbi:SDR family NAD(P)-dependent oxidoreductase [Streptomyces djakartensis]|uniref:3-oxoacyl-ACP reductase n=1 Tax=Streptomyces djakartensis TaxID=68193 RepID=A0ABQ3A2D9_9ACTN|nr:SDR family oxidoreductase [Streptomyces djakartensis]GGY33185.1 3-oxoacyl-ACP reductase [Streptomyces djakartensis]
MTTADSPVRRTVLVTGGGRGIGRSSVLAFARAGFDVAVNYSRSQDAARAVADEAEQAGAKTLLVKADVADETAVRDMADAVEVHFGRLDVLVNNAGTTTDTPPSDLDGLSMEDWDRIFAVNVRGTFQVTRACVPLLRRSAPAAVVNLASVVGVRPGPQPFPYAASKAAIVNLTRTLAGALGPDIRVNAVAPGWMEGEWMEQALGDNYEGLMARRAKRTPLRKCVTADDVATTILNLATSNPFVNGETVVIDGGYTATT